VTGKISTYIFDRLTASSALLSTWQITGQLRDQPFQAMYCTGIIRNKAASENSTLCFSQHPARERIKPTLTNYNPGACTRILIQKATATVLPPTHPISTFSKLHSDTFKFTNVWYISVTSQPDVTWSEKYDIVCRHDASWSDWQLTSDSELDHHKAFLPHRCHELSQSRNLHTHGVQPS